MPFSLSMQVEVEAVDNVYSASVNVTSTKRSIFHVKNASALPSTLASYQWLFAFSEASPPKSELIYRITNLRHP